MSEIGDVVDFGTLNLILTENPPYCLCAVIGRASHKT